MCFERLKRLFRRLPSTYDELKLRCQANVQLSKAKAIHRKTTIDIMGYPVGTTLSEVKTDLERKGISPKEAVAKLPSRPRSQLLNRFRELERQERQTAIVEKNQQRQKDTLGYGLKSRNFTPRPAYEKKLWNLQKKPEEDD